MKYLTNQQPVYFSSFHKLNLKGDEEWLDLRLDKDLKLYLDPFLIFRSEHPFFLDAKSKIVDFFNSAFELAHEAINSLSARKQLELILKFPEVMEIRLGDSQGEFGAGPGGRFAKAASDALVSLAEKKYQGLKHFEEIEIFTSGIGLDGISDATANIIKHEFVKYTQSVCSDLNIPLETFCIRHSNFDHENKIWDNQYFELPRNPCLSSGTSILLVPKAFLCTSPAISSEGFTEYLIQRKADELRTTLNYTIEKELKKSNFRKNTIRKVANLHPEWVKDYIEFTDSRNDIIPYSLEKDEKNLYRNEKKAIQFASDNPIEISVKNDHDFNQFIGLMIDKFKHYIEEKQGYKLLWNDPDKEKEVTRKPRKEDIAQCLFGGIISSYCQANDVVISREVETGRGSVDFKFSSGYQKRVLVELKLAKSSKLKQGHSRQLPAYLKAEKTCFGYYVIIAFDDKDKRSSERIMECVDVDSNLNITVIDARFNKPSGSNISI